MQFVTNSSKEYYLRLAAMHNPEFLFALKHFFVWAIDCLLSQ
jgi:hypothetical protein